MDDNALDFELAKRAGEFFRLSDTEMNTIINEVVAVVSDWKLVAKQIGISNNEISLMEPAFNTSV